MLTNDYDKLFVESIEKDGAKVRAQEERLSSECESKDRRLFELAAESKASEEMEEYRESAKTKAVREYIQLKEQYLKKKEILKRTNGRDPYTMVIELFLKKKTADQVAKTVRGELSEFNCELGSVQYGNREAIVYVEGLEDGEVLHVDNYGGRNVLVRG